jgi:hypothetical protein
LSSDWESEADGDGGVLLSTRCATTHEANHANTAMQLELKCFTHNITNQAIERRIARGIEHVIISCDVGKIHWCRITKKNEMWKGVTSVRR